jgi:hypothetical protein
MLDSRGAAVMLSAPTFHRLVEATEQQKRAVLASATGEAESSVRASMAAVACDM